MFDVQSVSPGCSKLHYICQNILSTSTQCTLHNLSEFYGNVMKKVMDKMNSMQWMQCIHMTIFQPLFFCFHISSWFLCNIFVDLHVIDETCNESDKQSGSYNMYCTSIHPLEHGTHWKLWARVNMPCTLYMFFLLARDQERW